MQTNTCTVRLPSRWPGGLFAPAARDILEAIPDRAISFEVFAGDCAEMECQARIIAAWGPNVHMQIPVTNAKAQSSAELVRHLAQSGVNLNVTAIMPLDQVRSAAVVDEGCTRNHATLTQPATHRVESPRAPECVSGRRNRLSHHHPSGCGVVRLCPLNTT